VTKIHNLVCDTKRLNMTYNQSLKALQHDHYEVMSEKQNFMTISNRGNSKKRGLKFDKKYDNITEYF